LLIIKKKKKKIKKNEYTVSKGDKLQRRRVLIVKPLAIGIRQTN